MIIISGTTEQEEQEIAAILEQALKEHDVQILQNDGQELSMEATAQSIAYNTKQLRIYTGRLERNTRSIEQSLRKVEHHLETFSTYILALIADTANYPLIAERIREQELTRRGYSETDKTYGRDS